MAWLRKIFGKFQDVWQGLTGKNPEEVYSFLRNQPLSMRRADFDIPDPAPGAPIWGVLMEFNTSRVTATLLTLLDGTTSLYLSKGESIIGGESHETIRQANAEFIRIANQCYQQFEPCESFPAPKVGQTIFYALTDSGVLTADGLGDDLVNGELPLSPLYNAGQRVIARVYQASGYISPDVILP